MRTFLLIFACRALAGCASTDDPKPAGVMLDPVTHLEIINVTVDAE